MKMVSLMITILLAGCMSASETADTMYLLPETKSQVPNSEVVTQRPLLIVPPVDLASFLDDRGIVFRSSESQIIQAKHNRWAQRLSDQITQRVIDDLRHKQSQYWPVKAGAYLNQRTESKLFLSLSKFNGNYQGNAELEGEWMYIEADGKVKHRSQVKILVPLQGEGYDSLVRALSSGMNTLTDDIARYF
ncbi:membrane integrity-associated transporter subunit PqiC [Vibrio fluvialis]|nr:membrane integrity-associated transporter subunit PqiC [Vibrio fluvialis]